MYSKSCFKFLDFRSYAQKEKNQIKENVKNMYNKHKKETFSLSKNEHLILN